MDRFMRYIGILKYLMIVIMFVFIIILLTHGEISSANIDTVKKSVLKAMDLEGMEAADNRMVKRFFGLNVNDYEGVVLYTSDSNMAVEELLIVKLKDVSQSETVENAIQKRLEKQLDSFEGYGAEQTKLLNDHVLDVKGNYILYVVNPKAKAADKAFQKSL